MRRAFPSLMAGLWVLAAWPAHGQSPLPSSAPPPLIRTEATTTLDASGRPWVFLTVSETTPGLLTGKSLAVFQKTGTPASAQAFAFRGVFTGTTDPAALGALISRSAALGADVTALDEQLRALHWIAAQPPDSRHSPSAPPPELPLAERLSALLQRAAGDTALGGMLDVMGLAHPAIRLARGTAWAGPLNVAEGTVVTLEIRQRDAAGADTAVVGRVTVTAGRPVRLPAPEPLAVVPDTTAAGDLTVKLRWATPDSLRRAVWAGAVVWRASQSFAAASGWTDEPPDAPALRLAAVLHPDQVRRVAGPVFGSKVFDATNVMDFGADSSTWFVADDNDRHLAGGQPMPEGMEVMYFVAAADPLGNPGAVSRGVPAVFCRRLPPPLPDDFAVTHDWKPADGACFTLTWKTSGAGASPPVGRYEIFRGDDLAHHAAARNGVLDLGAEPIVPGAPLGIKRVGAVEAAPGPPVVQTFRDSEVPEEPGRTWWYAIRAVHDGPPGCGSVASSLSPPVFVSMHHNAAPAAPTANQLVSEAECLRVACRSTGGPTDESSGEPLEASVVHGRARCVRRSAAMVAARFRLFVAGTGEPVLPESDMVFPEGRDEVEFAFTRPRHAAGLTVRVECRAVTADGSLSEWADSRAAFPTENNHFVLHRFEAGAIAESERAAHSADPLWASLAAQPARCDPRKLLTVSPHSGRVLPVKVRLTYPPGAEQWRLYRRIDDGPLTLVGQNVRDAETHPAEAEAIDPTPPLTTCTVTYYMQVLDENSNASPMAIVFTKKVIGPRPPAPLLRTPGRDAMQGTEASPVVVLSWVCPPSGIERFQVYVHSVKRATDPQQGITTASSLSFLQPPTQPASHFVLTDAAENEQFSVRQMNSFFLTGRVGPDFGGGPAFTLPLNVSADLEYTVWIRAIGLNGETGEASRSVTFRWRPDVAAGPVPWPARGLPPVASFHPQIAAVDLGTLDPQRFLWDFSTPSPLRTIDPDKTPVGIRVGALDVTGGGGYFFSSGRPVFSGDPGTPVEGRHDPNSQCFVSPVDPNDTLLPCVLYRQQVANEAFPAVSGDILQCSPLISRVAWIRTDNAPRLAELADPFFRWAGPAPNDFPKQLELFLVDTQPVTVGARYRYWLLRFDQKSGEPKQTVPCGEVTIADAP